MADANPQSAPSNAAPANKSDNVSNPTPANTSDNNGSSTENQRDGRGVGRGSSRGNRTHRGGRGNDRGGKKKHDMGRNEWARNKTDKRKRNDEVQSEKRQRVEGQDGEVKALPFSREEIEAEARQPKRKVAVMIGYAGSGYKGMQINGSEKTIEGDIFKGLVAAGAISKANADDPKKSSLVRCARTDKGVHAAGNVISLKLIVEDPDIVKKINDNLPPQIRVWGIERTSGAFSCYQACDSRWYEYLIPTYCFLPPHPQSFLGKKLVESAEQEGVSADYHKKQEDVADFWAAAEEKYINPILEKLDPEMRAQVLATVQKTDEDLKKEKAASQGETQDAAKDEKTEDTIMAEAVETETAPAKAEVEAAEAVPAEAVTEATKKSKDPTPFELAVKEVKAAYITAKQAYRISDVRRQRVQETLNMYLGTKNYHNYTIQKSFKDPSAKRVIRSFNVGAEPIIINDTEWLSLKVHGQSFMMHQIRKMVAMMTLVVRCGTDIKRMTESYGPDRISIPKVPGLGLLLERPVFDSYNTKAVNELQRNALDFDNYKEAIEEFKQREIYERIFREAEKDHQFHTFFHHIDNYRTEHFLFVTAGGVPATRQIIEKKGQKQEDIESEDEGDANAGEG